MIVFRCRIKHFIGVWSNPLDERITHWCRGHRCQSARLSVSLSVRALEFIVAQPTKILYASFTWWRHQMETFSALLALSAGNSPVAGEFPAQRPVTRNFDVLFDLRWVNGWVNNREAGELRCHRAHYDVIEMIFAGLIGPNINMNPIGHGHATTITVFSVGSRF